MTLIVTPLTDELSDLLALPFLLLKLEPQTNDRNLVRCPLHFEDGSVVHVVLMYTTKKRLLLGTKERISVAFAVLDQGSSVQSVFHRSELPVPIGNHDVRFCIKLSALIRAVAWRLYQTTDMGRCTELHIQENGGFQPMPPSVSY